MIRCRNRLRQHLNALIEIHVSPLQRTRAFTTTAITNRNSEPDPGDYSYREEPDYHGENFVVQKLKRTEPLEKPFWLTKKKTDNSVESFKAFARNNFTRVTIPQGTKGNFEIETRDPRDVLDQTNRFLDEHDVTKAHGLLERVTGKIGTVVAWNSLIRYSMDSHKVPQALRFYNDMKKRGEEPDTFTYSILLSGLASQPVYKEVYVTEAFKIYKRLQLQSKIRPKIVHTNGLLSVCLKMGVMDKAWQILSQLPGSGDNAPDAATYTVFFRGLQGQGEEAIADGRRAWSGLLTRWSNGDLKLDEYLVNAYLELLLSSRSDNPRKPSPAWREVFLIAHEVFGIPLLNRDSYSSRPIDILKGSWVTPDDFTLGILLRAAENLRDFSLAKHSWVTITQSIYNVEPSTIATHLYIRCASICHAGTEAVEILENPPRGIQLTQWNYGMALKACVTSGGPHESYRNAERVLATAEERNKMGFFVIRQFMIVAMVTMDPDLIKRGLLRIEPHLQPRVLENFRRIPWDIPRDQDDIINKLEWTLKKAIYWDKIRWGRFQQDKWMQRFRDIKLRFKNWGMGLPGDTDGKWEKILEEEEHQGTRGNLEVKAKHSNPQQTTANSKHIKPQRLQVISGEQRKTLMRYV